jgi:hypothetical protein
MTCTSWLFLCLVQRPSGPDDHADGEGYPRQHASFVLFDI